MQWRVDEATPEEITADPFQGGGAFLASAEEDPRALFCLLERALGTAVPATFIPGKGAWVDARNLPGDVLAILWLMEGCLASAFPASAP